MTQASEVLVVGAGPVGLMMASELYRHGAPCRLIEKLSEPSGYCKALGVTPRTLEVFDDLAIIHRALEAGLPLKGLVSIANGDPAMSEESSVAISDGAYGFLTLAQYDAERILAEHLESLGGAIERQTELVAFKQDPNSVEATIRLPNGSTEQKRFRYVVGCDGGRSVVRHGLNVTFEGEHYEQVFFLADVELNWDLPRGYAYKIARLENGRMLGGGACIPVPGNANRYRFSTTAPEEMIPAELKSASQPSHGISPIGPNLEQVQELLEWLYRPGVVPTNMRWSAFYRISHRIVSHYREGRVFLAGDAAHLHPPLGGQGMNTGLQDAYNLAWKLALVIRDLAKDELLESYDAERRPIGLEIVQRTTERMNNVLEGVVDELEPVREDSQLFLNYLGSPWVGRDQSSTDLGILCAGDRAPDATGLRQPFVRYESRLFDLYRGPHFTLLLYSNHADTDQECGAFRQIAETLRKKYGRLVRTYAILHPDCAKPSTEGLAVLFDGSNEFARLYSPSRGSAFLIRPDGYIGLHANRAQIDELVGYLDRILGSV